MKAIKDMNLAECIDRLRELPNGTVDDANVAVMFPGVPWIFDVAEELAGRIHELTRWIPVSERLPTKADANFHDEVMVSLDPMSLVNSPFGMMGIETVEYTDVCPRKHTHWKRTTEPEDL